MAAAHLSSVSESHRLPPAHVSYLQSLKDSGFEPKVIYDIGSCVLHWAREAKRLWPDATVVLFDAFESLEFLYVREGYPYHMGVLSDVDGKIVKFYQNEQWPTGNSYYREIGSPSASEIFPDDGFVEKTALTLDTVVRRKRFPAPDFVKLDVQGSEKDILSGAKDTLSTVRHLIVEMQHVEYNLGAPKVDETLPFIQHLGFRCVAPMFSNNGVDADYGFERV
jgi:FkbM family methyltransferase